MCAEPLWTREPWPLERPCSKIYDFPDPMQTSGGRDLTTNSLQQFFVMNSAFMHEEAAALAKSVDDRSR